jgi:hypothetical protein
MEDKETGCLRPVTKRETFQYVPILQLIAQLLSDSKVFNEVTSLRKLPQGFMHDFCNGSFFKSIPVLSNGRLALQVCLHFD